MSVGKNQRNLPGDKVQDPSIIDNLEYNNPAGSKKVSEVGRHLLPLKYISGGVLSYTTSATTARVLDNLGLCLAVYNNSGTVQSITLNESSAIVSLAPGATDATGHVGIPCAPNAWTYIACGYSNWVIASSSSLLVYLINDNTTIKPEWTNTPVG
jgi:hypothetical protein